jgi:hypothetical protein
MANFDMAGLSLLTIPLGHTGLKAIRAGTTEDGDRSGSMVEELEPARQCASVN